MHLKKKLSKVEIVGPLDEEKRLKALLKEDREMAEKLSEFFTSENMGQLSKPEMLPFGRILRQLSHAQDKKQYSRPNEQIKG